MKEPILLREEVDVIAKAVVPSFAEWTASCAAFAAALESALLEKLCREPIYQVWIEETSSYADVTAEYYAERLPSNRRIVYALNRSQS